MRLKCPACSAEMDLDVLLAHEEGRHVLAQLLLLGVPLGALLLRYVGLFRPARRALSMSRTLALLAELWPDMQRGAITRKGREWPTTPAQWQQAIEAVLAARDKGALTLPMTGHGYLHEVLMGVVDKAEREVEKEREAQQHHRSHKAGLVAVEAAFGSDGSAAGEAGPEAPGAVAETVAQPLATAPSLAVLERLARSRQALAEQALAQSLRTPPAPVQPQPGKPA